MVTIIIRNLDIDILINYLSMNYAGVFERVWSDLAHTHGVFIHEEFAVRTLGDQALTIIVDHDATQNCCELTLFSTGEKQGLIHLDWGSQTDAEFTFFTRLRELAETHGWDRVLRQGTVQASCPYCSATYVYSVEKRLGDGQVTCQNCGRFFNPDPKKTPQPPSPEPSM